MKKTTIALFFSLILFCGGIRPSFAGAGGIVFDPSNLQQMLAEFPTDLKNLASTVSTELSSSVTAAQQLKATADQVFFRPMQDLMMLMTIVSSSEKIKNLVLGGVGGQTSLLLANPERYIKQKGVESLKINVGYVSQADGLYSNSILDSVVQKARIKSDTAGTLASLSRSSLPKTIQDDVCEDSKLENLAMSYVTDADGNYDLVALRDKKAELNASLCDGDPNDPNNKELQENLIALGEQTNAGGWDKILAKTSGENKFTKTTKALSLIEQEKRAKEAAKNLDYSLGKGIISKTVCLVKIPNPVTGQEDCIEEAIEQTGDQLNTAFADAIKAPLDMIKNAYGTGGSMEGLGSIIGNVTSILGSVNSMRASINSVTGQMQGVANTVQTIGAGGDPTLQITPAGQAPAGSLVTTTLPPSINTPQTSSSYTQDLGNNPSLKTNIVKSINSQLKSHLDTLTSLEGANSRYVDEINRYSGYIETINTCNRELIANYGREVLPEVRNTFNNSVIFNEVVFDSLEQNVDVVAGLQYYTTKKNETSSLLSTIVRETSLVAETRNLINDTKAIIANSNSTQEISDAFTHYTETVENNNLPSILSGATLESDIINYSSKTDIAIRDVGDLRGDSPVNGVTANGEITIKKNKCASVGAAELARRSTKRQEYQQALLDKNTIQTTGGR